VTRRRWIALIAAAILVAAGALVWVLLPRDEPTRTSVNDAVDAFREESASGPGDIDGPPPGVYRYATEGGESAASAINTTDHDYDGVSTIVLGPGRCGELEHWQVLAERWSETESCPGPHGDRLVAAHEYHEFYGIQQDEPFRCAGGSTTDPAVTRPGFRFSSNCHDGDDSTIASSSRVTGITPVRIGSQTFPAVHTVTDSRIEGTTSGIARREEWRRRSDGLLLRRSVQNSAEADIAGGVDYTESYTLRLLDTEPRR
jgi:hypothetical protein